MGRIKKEIKNTVFETNFSLNSLKDYLKEHFNAEELRDPKVIAKVAQTLRMPQYLVLNEAMALYNSIDIKIKEPSVTWQTHEKQLLRKFIKKEYPDCVECKRWSKTAQNEADYFGRKNGSSKDGLVADSKFVKILEPTHVIQVVNYAKHPRYARTKILYIAKDTEIRGTAQELADKNGVIIERSHKKIIDGKRKVSVNLRKHRKYVSKLLFSKISLTCV